MATMEKTVEVATSALKPADSEGARDTSTGASTMADSRLENTRLPTNLDRQSQMNYQIQLELVNIFLIKHNTGHGGTMQPERF